MSPETLFEGSALGLAAFARVRELLEAAGGAEVRVTKSQVAFRARRAFAWLWRPGRYLRRPGAEVVLSIGLSRRLPSPRFKDVVQPKPGRWMHHLELREVDAIDAEVAGWLREARDEAGGA